MPLRRRSIMYLLALALVAGGAWLFLRTRNTRASAPLVALCPGPDRFGYVCQTSAAIPYLPAPVDTELYADDGLVEIELPFQFTFYGVGYDRIRASSNGNVQLTTSNSAFANQCLSPEPVESMGELIAPFWDDLDLRFEGWLSTGISGSAPERVFVIEWREVPRFGNIAGTVTFQVQLFEEGGDIAFLYQEIDNEAGESGRSATIGLQSAVHRGALQVGCNQIAVTDNRTILFPGPVADEDEAHLEPGTTSLEEHVLLAPKGELAELLGILSQRGSDALVSFRQQTHAAYPSQRFSWQWLDLTGDSTKELAVLWSGPPGFPDRARLALIDQEEPGKWAMLFEAYPLARTQNAEPLSLFGIAELTGDERDDLVLRSQSGSYVAVVSSINDAISTIELDNGCPGNLGVVPDGDGGPDVLVRENCDGRRASYLWTGSGFALNLQGEG